MGYCSSQAEALAGTWSEVGVWGILGEEAELKPQQENLNGGTGVKAAPEVTGSWRADGGVLGRVGQL